MLGRVCSYLNAEDAVLGPALQCQLRMVEMYEIRKEECANIVTERERERERERELP